MSYIADKLRAAQSALSEAELLLVSEGYPADAPTMESLRKALAEFPDPDAVGELVMAMRKIRDETHRPGCGIEQHKVAPGGHECSCPQVWAKAALAKLEEK